VYKLSRKSLYNISKIDKRLIEISQLAITLTLVDFGHGKYAGKRSAKMQHGLYVLGKSQCDGYDNISKHQSGLALDFYAYVNGKASWERHHLAMVAAAVLQAAGILGYIISWGGLWRSKRSKMYGWDMPHVELIE